MEMHLKKQWRGAALVGWCAMLAACGGGGDASVKPTEPPVLLGKTSFVSADNSASIIGGDVLAAVAGGDKGAPAAPAPAPTPSSATSTAVTRTVEQGDIYRVLEAGKSILNLNNYRGLQVIDISNPAQPVVSGKTALGGSPVEMYRVGNYAIALLNNWTEFKRVSKGGVESLDSYSGAAIVSVDISNRSAPKIISSVRVPGYVQASRMASSGDKSALYVAANDYTAIADTGGTIIQGVTTVSSFTLGAQGQLAQKSSLSLGGYIQAIQATANRLMVARADSGLIQNGSRVSLIDISSPDGTMVQGGEVRISGAVQKKTNMDVRGDILRVVSGNFWQFAGHTNYAETFNFSNLAKPVAVDKRTFGDGQSLFATTFLQDKAFFVTYLRKDPFHAFSVSATGALQEKSEFVVSGWNDYFFPAMSESRLVGVGFNDENNRRALAVSLYDISDLSNTKPLLARADVDLSSSWSEASFDDRAFTMLEGGANVLAADGKTRETGLILLPFNGYSATSSTYQSGVQIFTFSGSTITRRGVMNQGVQVRRSFMGDAPAGLAANLSDVDLTTFDINNVDKPVQKGSVSLAPSFSQFITVGTVGVRYRDNQSYFGTNGQRMDALETVALDNADGAAALGSISVPSGAHIYNVADKLAVVSTSYNSKGVGSTVIETYDVSDPAKPRSLGKLETSELPSGYSIYTASLVKCIDFCGGYYAAPFATVVGNSLVFSRYEGQAIPAVGSLVPPRYWSSLTLYVVNMSNAAKPELLPKIAMPLDEEAVGLVYSGNTVWVNYKKGAEKSSSGQAQARYYAKAVDLSNASAPVIGKGINIPGELKAVSGTTMFTVDRLWNDKSIQFELNALTISNDLAYQQATYKFNNLSPGTYLQSGNRIAIGAYDMSGNGSVVLVLDYAPSQFTLQLNMVPPQYGNPFALTADKLLLQVSNGILMYDLSAPKTPVPRAYLSVGYAYNPAVIRNSDVYLASGAFGIAQFKLTDSNLTAP